eukprot:Selendium_serpulae@DN3971_c0_g1_i2.p5
MQEYGAGISGLDQYCVLKYAEALECIPKVLGENAGHDTMELTTQLYAAHKQKKRNVGVNVEGSEGLIKETSALDHLDSKICGVKLATDAALMVLKIDQLIMSRAAGGPKPPQRGPGDDD